MKEFIKKHMILTSVIIVIVTAIVTLFTLSAMTSDSIDEAGTMAPLFVLMDLVCTLVLTCVISALIIVYVDFWVRNKKQGLFFYNKILLPVIVITLCAAGYKYLYNNYNVNKFTYNTFAKKVGYSGLYCGDKGRCRRYSIPKQYDEITKVEPPYATRQSNNLDYPYFIAKKDGKYLLIDKDNKDYFSEYDVELVDKNTGIDSNQFCYFFKIKHKSNNESSIYCVCDARDK